MWVFVDDDDGDNEMIMLPKTKTDYMAISGPILAILVAENGKTKK